MSQCVDYMGLRSLASYYYYSSVWQVGVIFTSCIVTSLGQFRVVYIVGYISLQQPTLACSSQQQPTVAYISLQQPTVASSSLQQPTLACSSLQLPTLAFSSLQQPAVACGSLHQPAVAYTSLQQPTVAYSSLQLAESNLQGSPVRLYQVTNCWLVPTHICDSLIFSVICLVIHNTL